jgi:hypothetical protein
MIRGDDRTVLEQLIDPSYDKYVEANEKYKINIQQVAKVEPLLDVLIAGDGYFVDQDISSLEPTVIAELSGDKTYREIYASGKPHDPYLYTAIKIMPWAADKVNAIYNIDNPTKESVAKAKKECKAERKMAKPIFLSGQFKAGPRRQWRMLRLDGHDMDFDTVKQMNQAFWGDEMFGDVVRWEKELYDEVKFNSGWMTNGLGRPFVVMSHKGRDVINIQSQSTGHMILDIWNYYLSTLVDERNLHAVPIVEDFHDERVWWAPTKEDALALKKAMEDSTTLLNKEIEGSIPFKGEVEICKTFSEFKEPDSWDLT